MWVVGMGLKPLNAIVSMNMRLYGCLLSLLVQLDAGDISFSSFFIKVSLVFLKLAEEQAPCTLIF